MALLDFINKVIDALKNGKKLGEKDIVKVRNILERRANTVRVASKAIATALFLGKDGNKIDKRDIIIAEQIITNWLTRMESEKHPFYTQWEKKKLTEILTKCGLDGSHITVKLITDLDIIMAESIKEEVKKREMAMKSAKSSEVKTFKQKKEEKENKQDKQEEKHEIKA